MKLTAALAVTLAGVAAGESQLRIVGENAAISLGPGGAEGDTRLERQGTGELMVHASVEINGTLIVNEALAVGGLTLDEIVAAEVKAQLEDGGCKYCAGGGKGPTYTSCQDWFLAWQGNLPDGTYDIEVLGDTVSVYCDMRNGGFTRVINILSTTSQSAFMKTAAVSAGTTSSTSFYKMSDDQINAIAAAAGKKDYLYICGDEVLFVARSKADGNWTSTKDGGGWMTDRDVDGRYDCSADRSGYIFADYADGSTIAGIPLHSDTDCNTGLHTNFGESSTQTGCYVSNGVSAKWANRASVWVGGQLAINTAIDNCIGENTDCTYTNHFDKLYDVTRRR